MHVQQHGNHLIQLTYYGFVNVYLVREASSRCRISEYGRWPHQSRSH